MGFKVIAAPFPECEGLLSLALMLFLLHCPYRMMIVMMAMMMTVRIMMTTTMMTIMVMMMMMVMVRLVMMMMMMMVVVSASGSVYAKWPRFCSLVRIYVGSAGVESCS